MFVLEPRGKDDPLWQQAVQIVRETQNTGISHLQRKLTIGYNRTACLIEAMEAEGIVSPPDHSGVRQFLATGAPDAR